MFIYDEIQKEYVLGECGVERDFAALANVGDAMAMRCAAMPSLASCMRAIYPASLPVQK